MRPKLEGRWFGTMALSEPQAGSSLADITTKAEPQDDGTYRLFGNKMWISGGDHELTENIVHLVLARIPGGPPGVKGISLFVVPKFLVDDDGRSATQRRHPGRAQPQDGLPRDDEHAAQLRRGRAHPGRAGRRRRLPRRRAAPRPRVHVPHDERGPHRRRPGRDRPRLHRLPAGARVRPHPHPGPPCRREGPAVPPVPIIATPTCGGCCWPRRPRRGRPRARACTAPGWSTRSRPPRRRGRAPARTCCSTCSRRSPRRGRRSGGRGQRPRHPGPRRLRLHPRLPGRADLRDNRLNPIHEGTNGIQALDLLGRKVVLQDGAGLALLGETIGATIAGPRAPSSRATPRSSGGARPHGRGPAALSETGDPERAAGERAGLSRSRRAPREAWIWLEQLLAVADRRPGTYSRASGQAARHFFRYLLPTVHADARPPGVAGPDGARHPAAGWPCNPPDTTTPRRSGAERRGVGGRASGCYAATAPTGSAAGCRPPDGRSARCSRS